ncbi:MAG: right-handed parallel beta-helix repeat-containing protein [Candidatus Latescibacterota bacterium]|nr:MAG: right-handed parallel beta-helix repeat-containing protein [Candidatus Latescibacterota bacterium]
MFVATIGAVFLLLATLRLMLSVPQPTIVVAAGIFTACALLFSAVNARARRLATGRIVGLLFGWVVICALLFGTTFWLDRAGWIWYQLTGYNLTLPEDRSLFVDVPITTFLREHPMFEEDPERVGAVHLERGIHVIDRTVVVPRGTTLTIAAGATLRFKHGCSLISYSPIIARGSEIEPILFTAENRFLKWGVVGVVGPGRSLFEHARFEHGRQARVNGLDFFGGLSLIGVDVEIHNCEFVRLCGKDAVYVRSGNVSIRDNVVTNAFRDGLDLESSDGEIRDNRFVNCGDEGIDLSHNGDLIVVDNVILDPRGGKIGADVGLEGIKATNTLGYTREN